MSDPSSPFRAGFVALLGRPNVGKSTLVNTLTGEKVAIVTPKPQTTRTRIQGIVNRPQAQVILVDTPGVAVGTDALRKLLRRVAHGASAEADLTLVVVEAPRGTDAEISEEDARIIEVARKGPGQVVVAINKIDRLDRKETLLPWLQRYADEPGIAAVVPVSALRKDGIDTLLETLVGLLPESPPLFPDDVYTDQAERVLAAELVREQLLMQTREEVPHAATVVVESFEDGRDSEGQGLVRIEGRIVVERDSQKGIVVGKGGMRIKEISSAARVAIEELLGCKVFVRLQVTVDKNWTRNASALDRLGLGVQGDA